MTQIKTTVLPAGPTKRVWVNKHHLPAFGGQSPTAPVWEVECFGERQRGFQVEVRGSIVCHYYPDESFNGPHAYLETEAEVIIYTAAEEAA